MSCPLNEKPRRCCNTTEASTNTCKGGEGVSNPNTTNPSSQDPYTAGYISRLGYLYCAPCWSEQPLSVQHDPVSSRVVIDSYPEAYEPCEACKRIANDVAKAEGREQ